MVKRAFCVAIGLLGVLLPALAQQGHHSTRHERLQSNSVSNTPLSLSLYRSKNPGAVDGSLLLHNGSVPLWLDGPQLSNGVIDPAHGFGTQWVQMGFTSQNLFPAASLSSAQPSARPSSSGRVHSSDGKDLAVDGSLLLHNGSVPLWLDGPQVSTGLIDPGSFASQWVQMGFTSQSLLPSASLNAYRPLAQPANVDRVHSSDGKDLGVDGKDIGDEMSPLSRVYYGGEIGFLYGRWSGKGGGDMWESYIVGTVGNDKFQITAGASYDEWNPNGRSVRFRSYGAPR